MINASCFFMLCNDKTEEECIEKGLLGDREWCMPKLKTMRKGDIGFLFNLKSDQLIGIFEAEGPPQLNLDPEAWSGQFPAQVKVKLISDGVKRINNATNKLSKFIELKKMRNKDFMIPSERTYGPEITAKVLALFGYTNITTDREEPQETSTHELSGYTLENVAGLEEIKKFIYQRVIAPFEDEETAYSLRLRIGGGILLFGPPGTGKTLISKSIAKEIQAKFVDISPSIIIGYPGEAEKRIESIFASIEQEPRAVVFLDEAEWILCKREDQTSSVMQRITPVLLSQLSRLFKEKTKPVIVIAATNKPEMIDTAFLRPGRFDEIFYVRLPDKDARKEIIKIHLRERKHCITDQDIEEIAEILEGYSGADIENIIEEAAFLAFERRYENRAIITKDDLLTVIDRTPKSVASHEIERLEKWAQERGIQI